MKNRNLEILKQYNINYALFKYPEEIRDTTIVAGHLGIIPSRLFKSLVIIVDESSYKLLMIPSDGKLDMGYLEKLFNAHSVSMATRDQAEEITGMQVGGISPLGIMDTNIEIFIDRSVEDFDWFVMSAGERGNALKINVGDFLTISKAKVLDLTKNLR